MNRIRIGFFLVIFVLGSTTAISRSRSSSSISHYERWLHQINYRFHSIIEKCLKSNCQCLGDLDHVARMAGVPMLKKKFHLQQNNSNQTAKRIRLGQEHRRRLATVVLANLLRLEKIFGKENDDGGFQWYQCQLDESSICPENISENYYLENRRRLISVLMPTIASQPNDTSLSIFSYEFVSDLDELLKRLKKNLAKSPSNSNTTKATDHRPLHSWFGREHLLHDLDRLHGNDLLLKVETVALLIVNRLVKGDDIELFESRFLRDIISRYQQNDHHRNRTEIFQPPYLYPDQLAIMLNDLHIGGLMMENETTTARSIDLDAEESILQSRRHNHVVVIDSNPDHHRRRAIRQEHHCLDYGFYLDRIRENRKSSSKQELVLGEQDIQILAPILLQQIVSKACERIEEEDDRHEHSHEEDEHPPGGLLEMLSANTGSSSAEAILYGIISVTLISFSSLVGVLLFPFLQSHTMELVINALIGLAFGSMAGDALFHLIPGSIGLHRHAGDNDHHDDHHHGDGENKEYLWLMLAVLLAIYLLFLFEVISNALAKYKEQINNHNNNIREVNNFGEKSMGHHHHHHHISIGQQKPKTPDHQHQHYHIHHKQLEQEIHHQDIVPGPGHRHHDFNSILPKGSSTISLSTSGQTDSTQASQINLVSKQQSSMISDPEPVCCWDMTSLAFIITTSDAIHNLMDGIAIGIAFSSDITAGISTSIAVFCHELPHEFGDFAVLLSTKMSIRRAALINFLTASTAFFGLYIGFQLGKSPTAEKWALAMCAGLFLYVALCDMLPELKQSAETVFTSGWFLDFSLKNAGILIGYGSMLTLAMFEDKIKFGA